jgi:cytochrome b involved in lipid metabolism
MNLKKIVTISLTTFIIAVVGVFIMSILISNSPQNDNINASEVAKHDNINDCWLIVSNKVYNVTNFISIHPGGSDKIIPYCGKDASTVFNTRNGKGPHPQKSQNVLDNYYVGNLN